MTEAERKPGPDEVWPHPFYHRGWRFWICDWCYVPRSLHLRKQSVHRRSKYDNTFIAVNAPHFKEGW